MQNYWPIIIVMAISGISWIAQRLKEQAAIKQAKDRLAQERNEELRTGRAAAPSPTQQSQTSDAQALQDLAARRQAQLRELRARQMQQGQAAPTPPPVVFAPSTQQRRPAPMPSGTLRPTPLPGGTRPVPTQRPTPRAQQQRRPEPASLPVAQQQQRVPPIAVSRPVSRAADVVPEVAIARSGSGDRLLNLLIDRTTGKPQAARVIILGEILGQPPSMRE